MKIDQNVMAVLSAVQCDGHRAVIVQQLDRKLYTQVNEVLVALGPGNGTCSAQISDHAARDASV